MYKSFGFEIKNIPLLSLELGIPENSGQVNQRLTLLKNTNHPSFEILNKTITVTKSLTFSEVRKIFKENQLNYSDKLAVLVLYSAEHEDCYSLLEANIMEKSDIADLLKITLIPSIRAKIAALELLAAHGDSGFVVRYLLRLSDSYLKSQAFLTSLKTTRDLKLYTSNSKYILDLFKLLDLDNRTKNKTTMNYFFNRFIKNLVETGIQLCRSDKIQSSQFYQTLNSLKLKADSVNKSRLLDQNVSVADLTFDILIESKLINDPSSYWDQSKKYGSTKLNYWTDYLFSYKTFKDAYNDPLLRSTKFWETIESFPDAPPVWNQMAQIESIQESFLMKFFMRHDDAYTD